MRGWMAYYCRFRGSEFQPVAEYIDRMIVRWAMRKYKRLRGHKARAFAWLERVKRTLDPNYFLTGVGVGRLWLEQWEPGESRGSRRVLRAAEGAVPSADSPCAAACGLEDRSQP